MDRKVLFYSLGKIKEYIEKNNYEGFDPYDGLTSPYLGYLFLGQTK